MQVNAQNIDIYNERCIFSKGKNSHYLPTATDRKHSKVSYYLKGSQYCYHTSSDNPNSKPHTYL